MVKIDEFEKLCGLVADLAARVGRIVDEIAPENQDGSQLRQIGNEARSLQMKLRPERFDRAPR